MPIESDNSSAEKLSLDDTASNLLEQTQRALSGARDELEAAIALHAKETKATLRRLKAQQDKRAAQQKKSASKGKKAKKAASGKKEQEPKPISLTFETDPDMLLEIARVRAEEAEALKKAYRRAFELLEKDLNAMSAVVMR